MHKKLAVLFVLALCLTFSSSSFSQSAQNSVPRNLLSIRPTDRITTPINEEERAALAGTLHPLATQRYETGQLPPEQRMERIVLVLRGSAAQEATLQELLRAQQDPGSPYYHHWLTPQDFGTRFGASINDVQQVTMWLQNHGMEVEEIPGSQRSIVFSGTAAQVESTFHASMRTYSVQGRQHFANATDPEIPQALSGVVHGVLSLHDFLSTPMNVVAPAYTSGGAHYLSPQDWATIYDVTPLYNAGITGSGQTIAVLGRVDILMTDVTTFRTNSGLPANNPVFVVNGTDPGDPDFGDQMESSLDVEWAGAIAKGAAIKFITSKSGSSDGVALSAQYAVTNNVAPVITLSYGLCEASEGSGGNAFWNSLWQQAAAQGQSVFVSSGDSGAAGCDSSGASTGTHGRGVNGLCTSPYSTCVGGTSFNEGSNASGYWSSTNGSGMGSALSYIPEAVWNESGGGSGLWSSGGGVSTVYTKPSWQSAPGVPTDGQRDVPDVSMTAAIHDAYLVQMQGSTMTVGGTSAAAPSLASAMTLIIQNAGAAQGNLNPNLYALATREYASSGPAVFHDITTGNNSVPGVTGFSAGTAYDQATGLGSIDANLLANHWSDGSATYSLAAGASTVTVGKGSSNTVSITLTASGGFNSPVTLSATGAPTGVTITYSSTSITSAAAVTATITASNSAAAGNSTITFTGTSAGLKHTVQVALTVVAPTFTLTPGTTSSTLTAGGTPATFTFTTAGANNFQSAVALSVTGLPKGVTAAFSPTSIASPGNGSSTLTLTGAVATAVSGSATWTVTATGGGVSKTQQIALTVIEPTFTITANAASVNLVAGSTATFTLATAVANFSSAIALSVSGLPNNVTGAFSLSPILSPGNGQSTLTLTAASNATGATTKLTVTATGGGVTKTLPLTVTTLVPTFTLTANSTSTNLVIGSTATFTLTSVGSNFSSAVALSVAGLPNNVAAAFSPTSIVSPGSGTSTLTLTAASNATAATTKLTVTATGGGVTKTLPLTIVIPAPSFTLAVGSATASVQIGSSGQVAVSDSVVNGFSSAVALTITGLPKGVTGTFSPASISAGSTSGSTLTLAAGSTAVAATTKLTVTATGGGVTKTQTVTLTVTH